MVVRVFFNSLSESVKTTQQSDSCSAPLFFLLSFHSFPLGIKEKVSRREKCNFPSVWLYTWSAILEPDRATWHNDVVYQLRLLYSNVTLNTNPEISCYLSVTCSQWQHQGWLEKDIGGDRAISPTEISIAKPTSFLYRDSGTADACYRLSLCERCVLDGFHIIKFGRLHRPWS